MIASALAAASIEASVPTPREQLDELLRAPSVAALVRRAGGNLSRALELATAACADDDAAAAGSFLQTSGPGTIPKNRRFNLACRCNDHVTRRPSGLLTANVPLGWCTANAARVTRIYTPGCATGGNSSACDERIGAIDRAVKRYFAPERMWATRWARIGEHHFSDFGATTSQPVLGTPGGDLAELLVALAVYEGLAFTTLDAAAVKTMLKKFVGATKKRTLYFATSQAALLEIARRLRVDYLDVRSPPAALRQRLLKELTYAGSNGCRHFRYLLTHHREYEVRRELGEALIAAYFEMLWDRDDAAQLWRRLRLVVTADDDAVEEVAVVRVRAYAECLDYGLAPLVPPRRDAAEAKPIGLAILHRQAAGALRSELADWVASLLDEGVEAARPLAAIQALAEVHARETLRHAFEGRLPVYEVEHIVDAGV